jgi:UDPglucose 6-dehydrogenase
MMHSKILSFFCIFFYGHTLCSFTGTIGVIGTGYVGLTTACLAEWNYPVLCFDCDEQKIMNIQKGVLPIYEPGLEELITKNLSLGRLQCTTRFEELVDRASIIFITVGTPLNQLTQDIDLSAIESVARDLSTHIKEYKIIVIKSTVPIGTAAWLEKFLCENGVSRAHFDIVSNPEFLREGSALEDFFEAKRIVIGTQSKKALNLMRDLYGPLLPHTTFLVTDNITAESIKYASNAFLTLKVSFINEFATLCDQTGANINDIAYALSLDTRIGPLKPGPGFGGSCFPKDTQALLNIGRTHNVDLLTVHAALRANEQRKQVAFKKLQKLFDNNLTDKVVAILGLSFKAGTDDIRNSPSIDLIESLLKHQVYIKAYDPKAMEHMKKLFPMVTYCATLYEAVAGSDALVIMTEWDEFKKINTETIVRTGNQPLILDMRYMLTAGNA